MLHQYICGISGNYNDPDNKYCCQHFVDKNNLIKFIFSFPFIKEEEASVMVSQ